MSVWLTQEICRIVLSKRATFKMLKETQLDEDKKAYQTIRNEVKKKIRAAKSATDLDLAKHCNNNPLEILNFYKLSAPTKSVGPLRVQDNLFSEDIDMVELLNSEFQISISIYH